MISTYSGGDQWIRRWSLVVTSSSGSVLELSAGQGTATGIPVTSPQGQVLSEGLRMKFRTTAADMGVPNHAEIWVYNCSDATAQRVVNKEFSQVILQAGYVNGRFGVIFSGQIKQVKRGRESATDSYLIIYAADSDYAINQAPINAANAQYLQRGVDTQQQFQGWQKALGQNGVQSGTIQGVSGGILPRSKVLWGMGNVGLDTTSGPLYQWSIQNGKLQVVPVNGYLPGEAIVLNAHSGLIGVPEATQNGVFATALINPSVKVRGLAKINNASINTSEPAVAATTGFGQGGVGNYPGFTDINLFASTSADGTYVILLIEYEGDTRGNAWYMHLGMLLQDQSTNQIAPTTQPTQATIDQTIQNADHGGSQEHSF